MFQIFVFTTTFVEYEVSENAWSLTMCVCVSILLLRSLAVDNTLLGPASIFRWNYDCAADTKGGRFAHTSMHSSFSFLSFTLCIFSSRLHWLFTFAYQLSHSQALEWFLAKKWPDAMFWQNLLRIFRPFHFQFSLLRHLFGKPRAYAYPASGSTAVKEKHTMKFCGEGYTTKWNIGMCSEWTITRL